MKKNFKKLIAIVMSAMMVFGFASCTTPSTNSGTTGPIVEAPEPEKKVLSVSIKYNDVVESDGYINVDLSAATIDLTATVRVLNSCQYTLSYTSSAPSVATVNNEGKVTLLGTGETVITAKAGDKSHSVVLIVSDNAAAGSYKITVGGGSASVNTANAGEQVSLTVNAEKTQLFKGWKFLDPVTEEPIENVWVNGNDFRMPSQDVLVKAEFDVRTYALKVENATIKDVKNEDTDVTIGGTVNGVTTYYVPANADVTLARNAEEDGETFVGWDYLNQGNRKSGANESEYSFTMPEEDLTVFAVFSETKALTFGSVNMGGVSSLAKTSIANGIVGEETEADADLQGMSGYSFTFSGSSSGSPASFSENVYVPNRFTTLGDGSQTVKILYKNHSNHDLTLEFYASQYATIASTGVVTVPANSVTEAVLVADYGFHNPSFGFMLRSAIGGLSSETVQLDMVWELADTYPYDDTSFDIYGAEYVELYSDPSAADYPANSGIRNNVYRTGPIAGEFGGENVTGGSIGGRKNVNNAMGMTYVTTRDKYTNATGGTRYIYAQLSNLPAYDENAPTTTVYFRFVNTNEYSYKLSFGLGNSTDVNNDTSRVSYELEVEPNGTKLFGLTIARSEADSVYFSIQILSNKVSNEYNFAVQMMYNNRMGVKPEDVFSKAQ